MKTFTFVAAFLMSILGAAAQECIADCPGGVSIIGLHAVVTTSVDVPTRPRWYAIAEDLLYAWMDPRKYSVYVCQFYSSVMLSLTFTFSNECWRRLEFISRSTDSSLHTIRKRRYSL
jgi:hypothetical protein